MNPYTIIGLVAWAASIIVSVVLILRAPHREDLVEPEEAKLIADMKGRNAA